MIHLSLTPNELDFLARVLMTRPYGEVHEFLDNIRKQVESQKVAPETSHTED